MANVKASLKYAAALSCALGALVACGSSTLDSSSTYQPITAIVVRAEAARAGKACSQAEGAVYKYAAILRSANGAVVSGGIYDCFSDAAFRDPPFDPEGVIPTFKVDVHAFSKAAFDAAGAAVLDMAARNGDIAVLGPASVTCEAIPRTDVEVVAVCNISGTDAGLPPSDARSGSDAADANDTGDANDGGDANSANDANEPG